VLKYGPMTHSRKRQKQITFGLETKKRNLVYLFLVCFAFFRGHWHKEEQVCVTRRPYGCDHITTFG